MRRTIVALLVVLAVVSMAGIGGWALWWQPRAANTCDGRPWGPSDARMAADQFASSLVAQDVEGVCRAATVGERPGALEQQVADWHSQLGSPASVEDVTVELGEAFGSITPLVLRTRSGEIELSIQQHAGQYRIVVRGS